MDKSATPALAVLLSLKDGADFCGEFVESLLAQSDRNFVLLWRDDASSDGGGEIVAACPGARRLPVEGALGIVNSYAALLEAARAEFGYFMFADQDDVWLPRKISVMRDAMRDAEARHGADTPLLIHSDLAVCDWKLRVISRSFVRGSGLNPSRNSPVELMMQNCVTGCATIFNLALAQRVRFPEGTICHDWMLALTAAAFGKIIFLPEALTLYRQHGANRYGAREYSWRLVFNTLAKGRGHLRERLDLTRRQARAFVSCCGNALPPETKEVFSDWASGLEEPSKPRRLGVAWRHRLRKHRLLGTIGMWWAL